MIARLLLIPLACALCAAASPSALHAAQDPNFSFKFGSYDGRFAPHTDTFVINALKPVRDVSMTLTSGGGHLPAESAILLDLSNAIVLDEKNTQEELSISLVYFGAGLIGEHTAAKVTFDDLFHNTIATATGTFVDGSAFSTSANVGFIPEPSSVALLFAGSAMLLSRRRHACCA